MKQVAFHFEPDATPCTALVLQCGRIDCAYGETGIGWHGAGGAYCHKCLLAVGASIAEFWRQVALGKFDADGYSPSERRIQQRKRAA